MMALLYSFNWVIGMLKAADPLASLWPATMEWTLDMDDLGL